MNLPNRSAGRVKRYGHVRALACREDSANLGKPHVFEHGDLSHVRLTDRR